MYHSYMQRHEYQVWPTFTDKEHEVTKGLLLYADGNAYRPCEYPGCNWCVTEGEENASGAKQPYKIEVEEKDKKGDKDKKDGDKEEDKSAKIDKKYFCCDNHKKGIEKRDK